MAKIIGLNKVLKNFSGDPLKDAKEGDLTLAEACKNALLVADEKSTGKDKYESFKIATKLDNAKGGTIELTAEEITKIKEAVGKYMFPMVVGLVWDALEGVDGQSEESK